MNALILVMAMVGYGDFTNQIALEAAKAKQLAVKSVALVPRSQCKKCNGTGKITAGDTVTVVKRDCDACYDDGVKKSTGSGQADPVPAPPAEVKPKAVTPKQAERPRNKPRGIFFTADWCGVCKQMARNEFPALRQQGWTIGDSSCDIEVVDFDARPDLVDKFAVGSAPTLVLCWQDREISNSRLTGYQTAARIKSHFATRIGPQSLRQWCSKYTGGLAYTEGMTQFAHLTSPASDEAHLGGHFEAWQLRGLTERELEKIHGGQHNGALTPFGALK